jgi:hypothetical protein
VPYPRENVRIRAGIDVVTISRTARAKPLKRPGLPEAVRQEFTDHDDSSEAPIELDREAKRELLAVLEHWLAEVGQARLPRGIYGLRNVLADEREAQARPRDSPSRWRRAPKRRRPAGRHAVPIT